MMLVPRNNSFDLFDDFFDDGFFKDKKRNLMRTDIREKKDKYIIDIDLPGFSKENIKLSLKNGYLEVHAKVTNENKEEKDDERFVRRERYFGECSRSFYVGDDIKEEDIDAEFKNGTLVVNIHKKNKEEAKEEIKQIEIK